MQDYAFDPVHVRGLGKSPVPLPPPEPSSPPGTQSVGLGQEPEGLGRSPLPRGIRIVPAQPQCQKWMLAFVNGARKTNVIALGSGFSYQQALNYFASLSPRATHYFTFTGSGGTFLFAFEWIGNTPVIKICVDGHHVTHTPHSRAPWIVSHPRRSAGMGAVFAGNPSTYNSGSHNLTVIPIPAVVKGTWVEVYPSDPTHQMGGGAEAGGGTQLSGDINQILQSGNKNPDGTSGDIQAMLASGVNLSPDGYLYFGMSDGNQGAAQTPGEPPGMVILRAHQGTGGIQIGMCTSSATAIAVSGVPVPTGMTATVPATPLPPPGVATWWQNAWAFVATGGVPPPTSPPPGIGTGAATGAVLGSWVRTRPSEHLWLWYPPAGTVALINGFYIYANAAALNSVGNPWVAVPMPTQPPVAGATGIWKQMHEGYWVWIGTGGTPATTTTSYTWLWVLLGLGVVGGVGYFLLD